MAVKSLKRGFALSSLRHFNETEGSRPTRVAIVHHADIAHPAERRKRMTQIGVGRLVSQIANVKIQAFRARIATPNAAQSSWILLQFPDVELTLTVSRSLIERVHPLSFRSAIASSRVRRRWAKKAAMEAAISA